MSLSRLPEVAPHLLVGPVQGALLLAGGPPCCAAPGRVRTSLTGIIMGLLMTPFHSLNSNQLAIVSYFSKGKKMSVL